MSEVDEGWVEYECLKRRKAKMRIYLNDPEIVKILKQKSILPIPIVLEGEAVLAKTKKGTQHIFFDHELKGDKEGFIPVFLDLQEKW